MPTGHTSWGCRSRCCSPSRITRIPLHTRHVHTVSHFMHTHSILHGKDRKGAPGLWLWLWPGPGPGLGPGLGPGSGLGLVPGPGLGLWSGRGLGLGPGLGQNLPSLLCVASLRPTAYTSNTSTWNARACRGPVTNSVAFVANILRLEAGGRCRCFWISAARLGIEPRKVLAGILGATCVETGSRGDGR